MRCFAILSAGLLITAIAPLRSDVSDRMLTTLLRDIPEENLSQASRQDSLTALRAFLGEQSGLIGELAPPGCEASCVRLGKELERLCERHVLPEAPLSRAVCYGRGDDERSQCLETCDE